MGQKATQVRGIHAALAAAGANIHPSLTPGSALWLWALVASVLFGAVGGGGGGGGAGWKVRS
jgi:hypothetical protein